MANCVSLWLSIKGSAYDAVLAAIVEVANKK